jgi:hypothetical protein
VQARFGTTQSNNNLIYTRPSSIGTAYTRTSAKHSGTTDTLYVDGTAVLTQTGKLTTISGTQSTAQLGRGHNNNTYFPGDIAEVLVYEQALSEADRLQVERYLQQKYAPTAAQPGVVSPPGYDEWYTYDAIGNLTSKAGVSYVYPSAGSPRPHAPTSVGGQPYTYDANVKTPRRGVSERRRAHVCLDR